MIVNVLQVLSTLTLVILTLGFATFCLLFHVLADWRASEMGRQNMTFFLSFTTILLYSCINALFHFPYVLNAVVALLLFGALSFAVWRYVVLLIKIQKHARASSVHEFWSRNSE